MKSLYPFKQEKTKKVLWVEVEVLDTMTAYGRMMSWISPVRGEGKIWVNSDKIKITK